VTAIDDRPADGHTAVLPPLLTVPLADLGPTGKWPRRSGPPPWNTIPDDVVPLPIVARPAPAPAPGPGQPAVAPAAGTGPRREWHMPDGDHLISWATAFTVIAVATFAAIVSYTHIHGLAVRHGEDGVQAGILPLSLDGVIAEASFVMLHAARRSQKVSRLPRFMLALGIGATVLANVAFGLPPSLLGPVANDVIGAALSAWPAGAFIGSVEMAIHYVRDSRTGATGDTAGSGTSDSDTEPASGNDDGGTVPAPGRGAAGTSDTKPPAKPRRRAAARRKPAAGKTTDRTATGPDAIADTMRQHPAWSAAQVAAHCGVSKRTVERRKATATPEEN
jgi:hypothetical protein